MRGTDICTPEITRLVSALDLFEPLGSAERTALGRLPLHAARIEAGQYIERQGETPAECCLLLEGMLCRYKVLPQGQRQILSFYYPGDITGVEMIRLRHNDSNVCSLSSSRVGYMPRTALEALIDSFPALAAAFWKQTLVEGAISREWLIGIGRRTALERMAHLLCEMFVRMKAIGIAPDNQLPFPLTQTDMADALGLSLVHVNRTLGDLRRARLIELSRQTLQVRDWRGLREIAGFDPTYLQLRMGVPDEIRRPS